MPDRIDRKEQAAGSAKHRLAVVIDVLHQLADSHADAKARDGEVMTAQPEQGKSHERSEKGSQNRGQRQCDQKRPLRLGDQHPGRVGADAEEGYVAERGIPGDPPDDVPGRRQHDEHHDVRRDPEPELVRQEWDAG